MRYEIKGETLPVVICQLESGESMITESGGMAWMSSNMNMETTSGGGIGKALGRMFSGDPLHHIWASGVDLSGCIGMYPG